MNDNNKIIDGLREVYDSMMILTKISDVLSDELRKIWGTIAFLNAAAGADELSDI